MSASYWISATSTFAVSESDCLNRSDLMPGEMDECINVVLPRILAAYAPAHEKNKQELVALKKRLGDLNKRIISISNQLKKTEREIALREEDLAYTKRIFEEKTSSHYRFLRLYDPLLPFFSSSDASAAFREINFRLKAADEDRKTMEKYAGDLLKLKNDKTNLEKNKTTLASLEKQVGEKEKFMAGEVAKVESYISSLSARQNELAALKAGGFSTSIGDVPTSAEPCSGKKGSSNFCDPGFSPAFAAFSYGAPHRKGMSQYGAYGRAKAGQDADTILHAYYGGIEINKNFNTSSQIHVKGCSLPKSSGKCGTYIDETVDIETYTKRIYEIPGSWGDSGGMQALKAQAVAARSYALARGGEICPSEDCQVYKSANKGGNWEQAVNDTRGWVLVAGGKPFSAWYASTAGGYTFSYASQGYTTPNLWDTPGGQGGWPNSTYEITGGSPWFYKGWYKSRGGSACGRSHPWLTSDEMADVLNAEAVLHGRASGDKSRVSPIDTGCWGGNPYSISELKNIGGITSVSGVSVIYGNDGSTLSVRFATNKESVNLTGSEFKKAFNLRAPGYIGLKSSLFNIEKI